MVLEQKLVKKWPKYMTPPNIPVAKFPNKDYVISDFGAASGGRFKNTEAINKAINF